MKGFFITGTDTGVGKTYLGALIARRFSDDGLKVGVMKPVESGCEAGADGPLPKDALTLMDAARSSDPIETVCPYALREAIAPNVAARLEGVEIDLDCIREAFEKISRNKDLVIVEGAGGLLAPLTDSLSMADLARVLGLPLIIVSANRLGTINHTMLTIEYASKSGLKVAGLVLNSLAKSPDESAPFNEVELKRLTPSVPFLGVLPFIDEGARDPLLTAAASLDLTSVL